MTDSNLDARLDLALVVAETAGAKALAFWNERAGLDVTTKTDPQDLVSEADRAVERHIRDAVSGAFPDDGFVGEEYGQVAAASDYIWVIDPIDGTSPFLHGMPSWCVAIALVRRQETQETVGGVIEVPTHGERFVTRLGGGTHLNGVRMMIPPELSLRTAVVGIGASHRSTPAATAAAIATLLEAGGMFFRNGSGALMLAYVAAGRLAGYYESVMHPWDCLAGLLAVREAGGCTAPFDPAREGRVLAAAPGAWHDLHRLFGAPGCPV